MTVSREDSEGESDKQPLDRSYSTSQTNFYCDYGAPFVALVLHGNNVILQSCCNHWDCTTCGKMRASQEKKRIIYGAEVISREHPLYFWTLTCRGRELSLEEAEANYYAWTNVLLTNARTKSKREGVYWSYMQVTERQQKTRQHPHSHLLTSFLPSDAVLTRDSLGHDCYISEWFERANFSAHLGSQHRISPIGSIHAVSRYISKYLSKQTMLDEWPKGWKRVRYSQNWPDVPVEEPDFWMLLNSDFMWDRLARLGETWKSANTLIRRDAREHGVLMSQ